MTELSYFYVVTAGLLSFYLRAYYNRTRLFVFYGWNKFDKLDLNAREIKEMFLLFIVFCYWFLNRFIILGASATVISGLMFEYLDYLRVAGGIVIIIFGIHFMQLIQIPLLNQELRVQVQNYKPGVVGSYNWSFICFRLDPMYWSNSRKCIICCRKQ